MTSKTWVKILLVALGALGCGSMWALSSPLGSSPDDTYHQATIWCVDATKSTSECKLVGTSEAGGRLVELPALVATPSCYAFVPTESAACQRPMRGQVVETAVLDNGEYPGGFYRVMHWLIRDSIPESVLLMRVVNVALGTLLLGAIALATTLEIRRLMAYTLVPVLVPLGWFIIASVNPSSWSVSGLTAYGFAVHTLLSVTAVRQRVAVALLGAAGLVMALAARGDAPVFAVVITGALCVLHWRRLWAERRLLVLPVVVGVACLVRVLDAAQVSSMAGIQDQTDRSANDVAANILLEFPSLLSGIFGSGWGLGWLDTPVPGLATYPVSLVIGYYVLTGLGRLTVPKALALTMILGPMLLFPLMTLYRARLVVGESMQPRYLLPLMPMLIAVLLTGVAARTVIRLSRVQAAFIWSALTVANTAAVYGNARRYVTGVDGPTIIGDLEWWWQSGPSPLVVTFLGGLGFAIFAAPILVMSGSRGEDGHPDALSSRGVDGAADADSSVSATIGDGRRSTERSSHIV